MTRPPQVTERVRHHEHHSGHSYREHQPDGFHHYASEFATSAQQAQAAGLGSAFSPVPYYLYCHSLELGLKAFLLTKGATKHELKNVLRHNLRKILPEARARGLEQTVPFAAQPRW